jgi:hypothetical protein
MTDLIFDHRFFHACITIRVEIVRPHKYPLLPRWDGKRSHARHDVADNLARLERVNQSLVLSLEAAVPVDLGVVEAEDAVAFADFHIHIIRPREDFVCECPEFRVCPHIVHFVNDSPNARVLVNQHFGNDFLIRQVFVAEVQVGYSGRQPLLAMTPSRCRACAYRHAQL